MRVCVFVWFGCDDDDVAVVVIVVVVVAVACEPATQPHTREHSHRSTRILAVTIKFQ